MNAEPHHRSFVTLSQSVQRQRGDGDPVPLSKPTNPGMLARWPGRWTRHRNAICLAAAFLFLFLGPAAGVEIYLGKPSSRPTELTPPPATSPPFQPLAPAKQKAAKTPPKHKLPDAPIPDAPMIDNGPPPQVRLRGFIPLPDVKPSGDRSTMDKSTTDKAAAGGGTPAPDDFRSIGMPMDLEPREGSGNAEGIGGSETPARQGRDAVRPDRTTDHRGVPKGMFRLSVLLPPSLKGILSGRGVVSLTQRDVDGSGDRLACGLLPDAADPTRQEFLCPLGESPFYYLAVGAFEPVKVELEPRDLDPDGASEFSVTIREESLVASASIVVVPKRLGPGADAPPPALKPFKLGKRWIDLAAKEEAVVFSAYFENIDPNASGMGKICGPAEAFDMRRLSGEEDVLVLPATCDFSLLDASSLPRDFPVLQGMDGCRSFEGSGSFCVFDQDAPPLVVTLPVSQDGIWKAEAITGIGVVTDLSRGVSFAGTVDLFEGTGSFLFGEDLASYRVTAAQLQSDGVPCGKVLEAPKEGETLRLAGRLLSDFGCDGGRPTTISLTLSSSDTRRALPRTVTLTRPLAAPADAFRLTQRDIFDRYVLQMRGGDKRSLPSFFAARLYRDTETCREGGSNVLAAYSLSASTPFIDLNRSLSNGSDALSVRLFNGERPITYCQSVFETGTLAARDDGVLHIELRADFIRPPGPYSLIVLSPSARLAEDGWRNILNAVLKDFINALARKKTAYPTDFYVVLENGSLQPVVAAEDFIDLPASGGERSVQARFDNIRYDAAIARPLDDINTIEKAVSGVDIRSVLLITDATDEDFEPRDMGSLYYWLIGREIPVHVISLGKCDRWMRLSQKTPEKIDCFDLNSISNLSARERFREVSEHIGKTGLLGSAK